MKRPNVLLLISDQQRYDTIHALGSRHMITPNLDRLVQEGCSFTSAHTSNPVCMPARHDLLTGFSARAHGYYANSLINIKDYGLPTLPRLFSENGYRTAAIGKMHFHPDREHHGFQEMHLMEELPEFLENDQYLKFLKKNGYSQIQNIHGVRPLIYHEPQKPQMPWKYMGVNWVADETIRWLEENGDHPYFLVASWIQPHPPWTIPKQFESLYEDIDLPEPVKRSRCGLDIQDQCDWFGDSDPEQKKREIRKAYYTSITMMDDALGRVLDYLEKRGDMDDTLIIFTSDHGEMLQDKGYYSKDIAYEGSVRIPMILRYPSVFGPDTREKGFADLLDILPTCLDLCQIPYTGSCRLPGKSLADTERLRNQKYQFSATGFYSDRRWVMCRSRQYKYIFSYNGGYEELYDMLADPGEEKNLLENDGQDYREILEELRSEVKKYEINMGPEEAVEKGELKAFPLKKFHPSVRGKYHYWFNDQFQKFYDRDMAAKGDRFFRELFSAIPADQETISQYIFTAGDWQDYFCRYFDQYACGKDYRSMLFRGKNNGRE